MLGKWHRWSGSRARWERTLEGFLARGPPFLDASRNPAGGCPTVLGVNELLLEPFALLYLESSCTVSFPHRQVLFALLINRKPWEFGYMNMTLSNFLKRFNFSCFLYSLGYFNEIREGGRVRRAYSIHQQVSFLNVPQFSFPIPVLTLY